MLHFFVALSDVFWHGNLCGLYLPKIQCCTFLFLWVKYFDTVTSLDCIYQKFNVALFFLAPDKTKYPGDQISVGHSDPMMQKQLDTRLAENTGCEQNMTSWSSRHCTPISPGTAAVERFLIWSYFQFSDKTYKAQCALAVHNAWLLSFPELTLCADFYSVSVPPPGYCSGT